MRPRQIYYRRKDKSITIEGKRHGKGVHLWTLPDAEKFLVSLIKEVSLLTEEKKEKIMEKMKCLDYKPEKKKKAPQKIHTTIINRTQKKDTADEEDFDYEDELDEDVNEIIERVEETENSK
jgi:hypothetical protein